MLFYSYNNYQACRREMVRHAELTDSAEHCVTARQWSVIV